MVGSNWVLFGIRLCFPWCVISVLVQGDLLQKSSVITEIQIPKCNAKKKHQKLLIVNYIAVLPKPSSHFNSRFFGMLSVLFYSILPFDDVRAYIIWDHEGRDPGSPCLFNWKQALCIHNGPPKPKPNPTGDIFDLLPLGTAPPCPSKHVASHSNVLFKYGSRTSDIYEWYHFLERKRPWPNKTASWFNVSQRCTNVLVKICKKLA